MMKIFFAELQRVVVLNNDLLEGVSKFFPILKKCILPIRDLLKASSLNATHVINDSDEKWFSLFKASMDFIVRANDLNHAHIKQGFSGDALLQKMDDVCTINLRLNSLDELECELERIHLAFDNALGESKVKDYLHNLSELKNLASFQDLFVKSPFVISSVEISDMSNTKLFYIEDNDLDVSVIFSGSDFENEFFEKWLVQDSVGPTKLESHENSYTFEDEEQFLLWINNYRAQFQIQLGLNTLTSYFDSSSDADIKRLQQIRHDLTNIMNQSEEETIFSTKIKVWNYIYGHLNSYEHDMEKRSFVELKSIYDLEDQNYRYNFY